MSCSVDLYLIKLSDYLHLADSLAEYLSVKELSICQNYRDEQTMLKKKIAYSLRKIILASFLHVTPDSIKRLDIDNISNDMNPIFYYSTSYTQDVMAFALSQQENLGLDIEAIEDLDDLEAMMDQYCSIYELDFLAKEAEELKLQYFYNIWTAKEAFLKMLRVGLARDLSTLTVNQTNYSFNYPVYKVFYKKNLVKNIKIVNLYIRKTNCIISICKDSNFKLNFRTFNPTSYLLR